MTFQDAVKKRNEIAPKLQTGIIDSTPPHEIEAIIIAPANSNINTKTYIFNESIKYEKSEEQILLDLNVLGERMEVFIVFRLRGDHTYMEVNDYLSSNFATGKAS
jgi:hypothetical protein